MAFFHKLNVPQGYLSLGVDPALKEVGMKDVTAFSGDGSNVQVREYVSPSYEENYLIVSEDETSRSEQEQVKEEQRGASSLRPEAAAEHGEESPMDRRLQRISGPTSMDETELDGVLHLPTHKKKEGLRLECRLCPSDLPVRMKNASAVVLKEDICVGGGYTGSPETDCAVYTYSSPYDLWDSMRVPAPCKWFGMVVFQERLVLVGGRQVGVGRTLEDCWNQLTVWNDDASKWTHSLPPMSTARVAPIVFTTGSLLVVAGGRKGQLDYNVEVLDGDSLQWTQAAPLPLKCNTMTSLTHRDYWYLISVESHRRLLFSCIKHALGLPVAGEARDSIPGQPPSWYELPLPPTPTIRIITMANFLLVLSPTTNNGRNLAVHAYFPSTQSWSQVGKIPAICATATAVATPQGELVFLGGDAGNYEYSNRVHKVSIATNEVQRKRARIVTTAAHQT